METSNTSGKSTPASKSLREVMRQHPLISFFFMAYIFSWIMSIPVLIVQWSIPYNDLLFKIFFAVKSFGPFLAAFIMISITEGKEGVSRFRWSFKKTQAGLLWYVFILIVLPAFFLLGILVMPGALASFQGYPPHFVVTYLVSFILIFFAGGPLGEEPGWRGYALPHLQLSYGPLKGTLLLGVMWVLWHLPDFLTTAQRGGPGTNLAALLSVNLPIFFLMVMGMAIIFTWVSNHTCGSIFIAILLHASINTFGIVQPLFTAPSVTSNDLFVCIGTVVPALLIIILTRGRLGYQPSLEHSLSSGGSAAQPNL